MNKLAQFLSFCLLLLSINTFSQSLGIDTTATNLASLPDSININDNYNHTVTVQNKNATPLNGTIWLMAAVDTGSGIVDIDSVGFANVTNFGLNDTVSISYNETYNFSNSYKLGGNIVVVWPIAANCSSCSTNDSLFKDVYIWNFSSIDEVHDKQIKVYPNPSKDFIYFKTGNAYIPQNIKIYDLTGKLIINSPFKPKLNVSNLNQGVYIVRVLYKEEELHFKLIKE